ncbi:hypothetical protein ACP70R_045631 [Stipagrostis hirtigluma subsp. patula]
MAAPASSSSASLATSCLLALLLAGCLAAAVLPAADARRLYVTDMPPAPSPAVAPAPASGADDYAGRRLFEGRGLIGGGLHLAGRLLLGLGL